jgi:hypothetical protein
MHREPVQGAPARFVIPLRAPHALNDAVVNALPNTGNIPDMKRTSIVPGNHGPVHAHYLPTWDRIGPIDHAARE